MRFYAIVGGGVIAALVVIGTYYVTMFLLNRNKRTRK